MHSYINMICAVRTPSLSILQHFPFYYAGALFEGRNHNVA